MSRARTRSPRNSTLARLALLALALFGAGSCAWATKQPSKQPLDAAGTLAAEHAQKLRRHRPDLAERWTAPVPEEVLFEPLIDASTAAAHERDLRAMLERAGGLPAAPGIDSLRARLAFELEQTAPGGALHTDALLWIAIVEAAARAPFAYDSTAGCREVERAVRQLQRIPEALRGAAVLMRGAPLPEPVAFEAGLTRAEQVFRNDLPRRTKACREGGLLAQFVEADSLAAASLMGFRRLIVPGP